MFDKNSNPIKKLEVGKVEKINDVWMGRSLTFFNTVSNRLTNMRLEFHFSLVLKGFNVSKYNPKNLNPFKPIL